MVSRSARVGQAFGSKGVLNNAAKSTVEAVAGGGVTTADNDSAGLGSGVAGDLKFASNRKTLHMYDGTEWDRIAGGTDAAPVITEDAPVVGVPALATDSDLWSRYLTHLFLTAHHLTLGKVHSENV